MVTVVLGFIQGTKKFVISLNFQQIPTFNTLPTVK